MFKLFKPQNAIPILAFFAIIMQVPIWPFWSSGPLLCYLSTFLLFLYSFKHIVSALNNNKTLRVASALLFIYFVLYPLLAGNNQGSNFVYFLCYLAAGSMPSIYRSQVLKMLTIYVAIIVVISLPTWLCHISGIFQFPMFQILDLGGMKNSVSDYAMGNYGFFVMNLSNAEFPRFYSMFDEPGVLGTLGSFILLAQHYNFKKWYNVTILLGCVFTYSFAFYLLALVGYLFNAVLEKKKILKSFMLLGLILFSLSIVLENNETFQRVLLSKFNAGIENSLNDRTSVRVDRALEKAFENNDIFLGLGYKFIAEKLNQDGSSYKIFLIDRGLVGCLVLFLSYFLMIPKHNKYTLLVLFIFVLSFGQRMNAFTSWQFLIYSVSVGHLNLMQLPKGRNL